MDFNARVAALTADGFTFTRTQKIRGTTLRRVFGSHPCGVTAQVDEMATGAAFYRVSK